MRRSRAVSSIVPVPTTRSTGRPLASVKTRTSTSTGFETITTRPRAPRSRSPIDRAMPAVWPSRSRRDSPPEPPRPAARTTASASSSGSSEPIERTAAAG